MHYLRGVKTTTTSKKSRVKRKVAKNAAIAAGARPTKQAAKAKRPEAAPPSRAKSTKRTATAPASKKRAPASGRDRLAAPGGPASQDQAPKTGSTKAIETAAKALGTVAGKIARAVEKKA